MIYGSVCSGIESASVAWHPLGWRPAFFSEIDKFPRAVLAHHWPEVPLHGDFTTIEAGRYPAIDLLVGGTPCQDFSVAGLRAGLAGERGNLTLEYLRLAGRLRPKWLVWENVPGVMSSDGGRALGAFLGGLAELGYGFAWRVLDAQYVRVDGFGRAVPQRRRRVFVVGYLGDWRRAAAVLFERASLCGDPAPCRETGEGVAGTLDAGAGVRGQPEGERGQLIYAPEIMAQALTSKIAKGSSGPSGDEHHHLIAFDTTQLTNVNNRSRYAPGEPCHGLSAHAHPPAIAFAMRGREAGSVPEISGDVVSTLRGASGGSSRDMVAFKASHFTRGKDGAPDVVTPPLSADADKGDQDTLITDRRWAVRRLTPRECERLQGFPDDFTLAPVGRKLAADGPRYKALGNSMAVNVMRWIGHRIERVEAMHNQFGAAA